MATRGWRAYQDGTPHQEEHAAPRGPLREPSARAPSRAVGWGCKRPGGEQEAAPWGQGLRARPAPPGPGVRRGLLRAHAHALPTPAHAAEPRAGPGLTAFSAIPVPPTSSS